MSNHTNNEVTNNEVIHIEEEFKDVVAQAEHTGKRRFEEFSVRGGDLKDTLGRLAREATARKITLRSESGKTLAENPLAIGAAGVLIIGPWTAALLAAAWLTRVSILIEYEEAPAPEAAESAIDQIEVRIV